ncbi:MAG TPA: DUF308 domain-containing protein [Puia sp.]|nr:DUF308 domain-containing protein [Puia sp.]
MPNRKHVSTAWLLIIAGFVFLAVGCFLLLYPWHAYFRLAKYTWLLLLINAFLLLYIAIRRTRGNRERNWILSEFVIDILFTVIFLFNAFLSILALPFFIATWMGIMGALKIMSAFTLKRKIPGWGFVFTEGLISLIFSIWVFGAPAPTAISGIVPIGLFAILMGAFNMIEAFRFNKMENTLDMML